MLKARTLLIAFVLYLQSSPREHTGSFTPGTSPEHFAMDGPSSGSMQFWLAAVMARLGPLMALIVGFVGADRFLRRQAGETRQRAPLDAAAGGEIGPINRGPEVAQ